jgi:flagellar motor switch protein FliM
VPGGGGTWGKKSQRETVTLIAQLATTKLSAADLRGLGVGDLITTEAPMQDGILLCVDGVAKFRAHPGASAGRKAARIED